MTQYKLRIEEHLEYGDNGIVIERNDRDYFEPATMGLVIAHDLLEHPVKPHDDGFVDELMALGAVMAGRMDRYENSYGRVTNEDDVISDVQALARASLAEFGKFDVPVSTNRVNDSAVMEAMRRCVRKGLLNAVNEHEDTEHQHFPSNYRFDLDSMVGHMARGYQLFRQRFPSYWGDFADLFAEITRCCDGWLKDADVGHEAILSVNIKRKQVALESEYETFY